MSYRINTDYEILTPFGFEDFDGIQVVKKKSVEIFFDNEISIRGSLNHIIFDIDGKPISLKNIKKGTKIKSPDGFLTVIKTKKFNYPTNLYDIVNSGEHHIYMSNGVISHNCDFLGSGDNVFDEEYIKNAERMTLDPIEHHGFDKNIWVWEHPVPHHQYIMAGDVSRGDSLDYSTFTIWDMETHEQVVEYQGKIPPDSLGEMMDKWGRKYEALCIVDVTGGMGQSTVIKLMDLKYPWMHYSEGGSSPVLKSQFIKYKKQNMIPGLMIGMNRTNIISTLEIAIRTATIKIKSKRLIGECRTFVYKNGRPDHMPGKHDDLIFATAMVLFVFQHAFKNLKKFKEQTAAMLKAYDVVSTTRPSVHNSRLDDATDFSWLFNK